MKQKLTKKEKDFLREIGYYFLKEFILKNNNGANLEDFQQAEKESLKFITDLGIKQICYKKRIFKPDEIVIGLSRPGLLIGYKGKNIKNLTAWLCRRFQTNIEIIVFESEIDDYLFPIIYDHL